MLLKATQVAWKVQGIITFDSGTPLDIKIIISLIGYMFTPSIKIWRTFVRK